MEQIQKDFIGIKAQEQHYHRQSPRRLDEEEKVED